MSSSKKAPVLTLPEGITEPYKELELKFGATATEIKKGYRALSRIHHPDKHVLKSDEKKAIAEAKFMTLKAAYDFLCDDIQKKLYDDDMMKKQNAIKRKVEKDGAMDAKRRALKRKLDEEESKAKGGISGVGVSSTTFKSPNQGMQPPSSHRKKASSTSKETLDKIRKENRERMEKQGNENEQRASDAVSVAAEIRDQRNALGIRSVSIKWKRKVHNFSEEDIINLLKPYGDIDSVNFVGSKGNAAIVIFINADDASACAAYASTDSIRIDVVKSSASWASPATTPMNKAQSNTPSSRSSRDTESLDDFNKNRAYEREKLMKKLADEEAGIYTPMDDDDNDVKVDRAKVRLEEKLNKHANDVKPTNENFFKEFLPIKSITLQQLQEKEKRVFEFMGCLDLL